MEFPVSRQHPRHKSVEEHGIMAACVRPGHRARLLNISAGGALVETSCRLLPGAKVELLMEGSDGPLSTHGRVLRCTVSRLRPNAIWYRGAIAFDRHLPWPREDDEYPLPAGDQRPGRIHRAPATQESI